ncbi:MAG: dienelactone hydrolase family protein [Pseudomonadota bacterium]|jgi:carboxymethylenebutenolidase|nr:MAG: carboxymethylenebutenolidase [Pseudomonadota bacterium]
MKVDPRVIELYNEYIHSTLPRREFLARLTKLTGGVAAAAAVLPLIEPDFAHAVQVPEDDPRLDTGYVTYRSAVGEVRAYRARPKGAGKLPAILVIHENRGLNPHIEDVARRAALAGYFALAPDGLSVAGGAPRDQEAARDLFAKTDPARIAGDIIAGVPYLAKHSECTGRVGVVGFCYGGGLALRCAVEAEGVTAAVGFYGRVLPSSDVPRLKVPVMLHYAGNDTRINEGIPEFRKALDAAGVAYSINMYPGTEHGFHNDTSAARYDPAAARLAWQRTIDFFDHYLKGDGATPS